MFNKDNGSQKLMEKEMRNIIADYQKYEYKNKKDKQVS